MGETLIKRFDPSSMFLKRKIVALLNTYHIKKGWSWTPAAFEKTIAKRWWPRINYPFLTDEQYANKIKLALLDCIQGNKKYIEYQDEAMMF